MIIQTFYASALLLQPFGCYYYKIMDSIDARIHDAIEDVKLKVVKKPKQVKATEHLLRQLRAYEESLKSTGSLPYRHQIQLNAITEAHAVLRGRTEITQEDIDTIAQLSKWMNYAFKEI